MRRIIDEYSHIPNAATRHYHRNKEALLAKKRERLKNDPEFHARALKYTSDYSKSHREKERARRKLYEKKNPAQRIFQNAKSRAKRYGVPINIAKQDILIPDNCPILGIPLRQNVGRVCAGSPSLDRIKPELGYVKGNVRVISHRANAYKSNLSENQIKALYDYVRGLR